ncbi:serum paraoxonase/arylesterase family protein [Aspergillus affinis]|uniref:serum paraoxonase/arylesterase family protein n=1 Tax=Aspergillus affinis TaxID=1070780 RepID=UPI0022FE7E43|nr:serum paraoxonase/arylesterase family protein [Aspergillus affinis]KAI9040478.1 serum paraoxonase/arylesterase family protein [Aspergillus affinis]
MGWLIRLAILCAFLARYYTPVVHYLTVFGVSRTPTPAVRLATEPSFVKIEDTVVCEDLHYYEPAGKIFTACEDHYASRFQWFPPLGHLEGTGETVGSLHVIDPKNFQGPFVTHGIDVIADPTRSSAVYIFAVNHLPNPEYDGTGHTFKARSQIELFHHVLGSGVARHVRSIRHSSIVTPNDIYAESPSSFYVTNDHYYRHGLKRMIEDVSPWAQWTDVVHVRLEQMESADAEAGINATTALTGIRTSNGIGCGRNEEEMLVCSALGGIMYRARADSESRSISIVDEFRFDSTIDNPSYFVDPYRTPSHDASGYVLAGLLGAANLTRSHGDPNARDGVMVWHARRKAMANGTTSADWETRLIFEDDGSNIHTGSSAVMVPTDSAKRARLFVTGFSSEHIVAVEVEL